MLTRASSLFIFESLSLYLLTNSKAQEELNNKSIRRSYQSAFNIDAYKWDNRLVLFESSHKIGTLKSAYLDLGKLKQKER